MDMGIVFYRNGGKLIIGCFSVINGIYAKKDYRWDGNEDGCQKKW